MTAAPSSVRVGPGALPRHPFSAFKAAQILREGRAPETIPVETLTRLSFLIRMETARLLGSFPPVGPLRVAEAV